MKITFKSFAKSDIKLYYKWCKKPHIKEKWFREGYAQKEKILEKIGGINGVIPYIIMIDNKPIGYIQSYIVDKTSWKSLQEYKGQAAGFDIFIGEEDYVGKNYGSTVVKAFTHKLLALSDIEKVLVDPFADDARAIRCYEKAGFKYLKTDKDDIGAEIYIMIKDKT